MTRRIVLAIVAALSIAGSALAQNDEVQIDYKPVTCIRTGEMAVLQMNIIGDAPRDGELRAFFRKKGASDWCAVIGKNDAALSHVTLPKFEGADEIEYYFIVADNREVLARSPEIYSAKITPVCDTIWARHAIMVTMSCGTKGGDSAMNAGRLISESVVRNTPPTGSPDNPDPNG